MRVRRVNGLALVSLGDRAYRTEDGRFEISYDDTFPTDCDEAHPARIANWQRANHREWRMSVPLEVRTAIEAGKQGYLCPGNQEHFYGMWGVAEVSSTRQQWCESFQGAVEVLKGWVAG